MAYRKEIVIVRLSATEKNKLKEKAKKEELSISEYIRKKCNL